MADSKISLLTENTAPNPTDIVVMVANPGTSPLTQKIRIENLRGALGIGAVENTSDADKPVSTAQQAAIDAKVEDAINDSVTTIAPAQNAVFDALALKQPLDANLTALAGLSGVQGDIIYRNATQWQRLPKGTANQELRINAGATAPEWFTPSAGGSGPTYQTLASDATANLTTTFATVMATTIGSTGTYAFKYFVRYQALQTTTGVKFQFTFNGTVSTFVVTSRYQTTGGAAATGAADQVTTTTAQLIEGWSVRALSQPLGPTLSVDTLNADMLMVIEGLMIVTGTGTFNLQHASEVAFSSTVKAGTSLILHKTA